MEMGISPIHKVPWDDNEHVFVSYIFQSRNNYTKVPMKLNYYPDKTTITLEYNNNKHSYNISSFTDIRKLIPILLLSK